MGWEEWEGVSGAGEWCQQCCPCPALSALGQTPSLQHLQFLAQVLPLAPDTGFGKPQVMAR